MTRSTRLSAVVLSSLLLGYVGPARADDAEEAKRYFVKAQTAYKLNKYIEAIENYEAAYRALPDAAFLFNIAQAQRQQYALDKKVDRLHKALALYKAYLRDMPQAPNRNTVMTLMEELQKWISAVDSRRDTDERPGTLTLRGDTATGGTVLMDGKELGKMPLSRSVPPGPHLLQVRRAGFREWSTSLTVAAGSQVELPVILQAEVTATTPGPPKPTPVYKRWWFWTVIGVVVVAGAGAGVGAYYGTRGESIPAMPTVDLR